MPIKFIFLWSDLLVYLLFISILLFSLWARRVDIWRAPWARICQKKLVMMAGVFLLAYASTTLLDSIHFKYNQEAGGGNYRVQSLLDYFLKPLGTQDENTYSAPFALYSSAKVTGFVHGKLESYYPRLKYSGIALQNPAQKAKNIVYQLGVVTLLCIGFSTIVIMIFVFWLAYHRHSSVKQIAINIIKGKLNIAWREILIVVIAIIWIICFIKVLSLDYHILGTDKIGHDILYETIKSIRTGLIIGTLTTLVMLPFAVFFGAYAGYYGGWRDDVIQYLYTTLSSIPGVLLISAAVLSLQVFIANHVNLFPTLESRADVRLLALCFILGITSWTSLCRLIRADTLKLREMDYVKAAVVLGATKNKILLRHILPNVMHIIVITLVLDFSGLVLAEAVLSYVGVGVDPITPSWGNMINSGRLDLARDPVVWWPLFAAFLFMFILVLSANLFADALRDAFDPRQEK